MTDPKKREGKRFTESDIRGDRLSCLKTDLIYNPPEWLAAGRQESSSGYGHKLNSGYSIRFENRVYRVYVTIFSNAGTCWFKIRGRMILVSAH